MEKFLYFAVAGDNAAAYPVSALKGIDTAAGAVYLYFNPQRISNVATGDNVDRVHLACGTDEKAAIKAIVDAATATGAMKEPLVTIADGENSIFIGGGITGCTEILYAV